MPSDMFSHNQIARAVRLLCQSAAAMTADAAGGIRVTVGSNALFAVGAQVRVRDSEGQETGTIAGKSGLTGIDLSEPLQESYLVSRGARIELAEPVLPELQWVGQGAPELLPRSAGERFPCVVVLPDVLKQPFNQGSNRTVQQEYWYRIYYVERFGEGDQANVQLLDNVAKLFNLLMSDTYLGGTCWHSQVTEVDPQPRVQERLREQEMPLRVAELTLVARRAALWAPEA